MKKILIIALIGLCSCEPDRVEILSTGTVNEKQDSLDQQTEELIYLMEIQNMEQDSLTKKNKTDGTKR